MRMNYSLLKLYCDWTMHPDIDRSNAGAEILATAHQIIADHLTRSNNAGFASDMTSALSLSTVRMQFNSLLEQFGAHSEMISTHVWAQIVPHLAEIVSHCPLKLDMANKKFAKFVAGMKSRPLKGTSIVEELMVAKIPSTTFDPKAAADQLLYCIVITTSDTTRFVVPMASA